MKILVLAGGYDQKDLILELKRRKHQVLLADYFPHPPAKDAADAFYQISTLDVAAVQDLAAREQVDRVTTACTDQALLTAAQVSEALDLPCYLSYATARNVTNKAYMKGVFSQKGIPTAPYVIVGDSDTAALLLPYPRVVKPVDCNSSKGVRKVADQAGMAPALAEAIAASRTNTALVETFLPGNEVSVDAYVQEGAATVLMISETIKVPHTDGFTIVQSRVPVDLSAPARTSIATICQQIAGGFGLHETPLLVQCVVNGADVGVLEFSARMGGGTKHRLIEALTGVDMIGAFADLLEEKRPRIQVGVKASAASLTYCYGSMGTFSHIEGVAALADAGVIVACYPYKTAGMVLEKAETSSDRVCGFLVTGQNVSEVAAKEAAAGQALRLLSNDQRDLFRRDLLPLRN